MQFGTLFQNIVLVGLAALAGGVFALLVINEGGPKVGALIFGLGALFYLLYPRTEYLPGEDGPEIFVKNKSFMNEGSVHCYWAMYDHDGKYSGWCVRRNNEWQKYIIFDDGTF